MDLITIKATDPVDFIYQIQSKLVTGNHAIFRAPSITIGWRGWWRVRIYSVELISIVGYQKSLNDILAELRAIHKVLRLSQPGIVSLRITSEGKTMSKFVLDLPVPSAVDVVSREITITVGTGTPQVLTLAGDAIVTEELDGVQGDSVTGQLVDIDDAGNRSDPSDFDLVLIDNQAPPMPGQVGIRMTAE